MAKDIKEESNKWYEQSIWTIYHTCPTGGACDVDSNPLEEGYFSWDRI